MDIDGRSKDDLEQLSIISDRLNIFGCKSNHNEPKALILGGKFDEFPGNLPI